MLKDDWVVGFTEGEGTFTVHSHWNHTTRSGESVYYKIDSPTFQVSQKEREVCDAFVEFFGFGRVDPHGDSYEYKVIGYENCRKVALFFRDRLILKKRCRQFDEWCERYRLLDDARFDADGKYRKGHSTISEEMIIRRGVKSDAVRRWIKEHPDEVAVIADRTKVVDPTKYAIEEKSSFITCEGTTLVEEDV